MASETPAHVPVMMNEVLELLQVRPDGIYVDATAGAGGHAVRIAAQLCNGRLLALDRDSEAVTLAANRLRDYPQAQVIQENYSAIDDVLAEAGIAAMDGILFDLGASSMQLDTASRGFSFQTDGPLDMRMDADAPEDAAAWLARAGRAEIIRVLREYGDVGPAGRIASRIIARREDNHLSTTSDLAAAVTEALDFVTSTPSEIRTVFQAIRIAVNEELKHLEIGLHRAAAMLAPGGRIVAITFHSGEDRVVKQIFRKWTRAEMLLWPDGRVREKRAPFMRAVTRKPLLPTSEETDRNPRAKSAKVRAVERITSATADE